MIKSILIYVVLFFSIGTMSVAAQSITDEFKVAGNCGMCETRIENAAKSVKGVMTAEWDKETKIMKVSFDNSKTDKNTIQKAIAKVGHDTGKYKTDNKVYEALPMCCKYERKAVNKVKKD